MEVINIKQQAFIDEYIKTGVAVHSYMSAYEGVSYDSARSLSSDLLAKDSIQQEITRQKAQLALKSQITRESILQDLLDIKNAQKNQNSMASLKALEIINRMLGFNEASKIQVQSLNLELKFPDLDVPKLLTDKEIENDFKNETSDDDE